MEAICVNASVEGSPAALFLTMAVAALRSSACLMFFQSSLSLWSFGGSSQLCFLTECMFLMA
eukprot:9171985-Pyramimonas_sp.AAC.1